MDVKRNKHVAQGIFFCEEKECGWWVKITHDIDAIDVILHKLQHVKEKHFER